MELRINGAKERPKFGTNIGSPQGDGLSGMLFNIYFEDALRHVRQLLEEGSNKTEDHTYAVDDKPKEFVYADDSDFLSLEENDDSVQKIEETLKVYNLTVNVNKTEKIVIKRGERLEEFWRKSKKLGSLLGVRDIDSNPSIRPEYRVFGTSKPNPNIKILKSEYRIRIFCFFAEYRIIQGPLLKNPNIPNIGLLFCFTIFFCFFFKMAKCEYRKEKGVAKWRDFYIITQVPANST